MRASLSILILLFALSGCDLFGGEAEDMSEPRWYFPLAVGNEWHYTETYSSQSGGQHSPVVTWHTRRRVLGAEEGGRFRVEITVRKLGATTTVREAVWFYDEARGAVFEADPDSPTGDVLVGCTLAAAPATSPTPCRTIQEDFFVMSGVDADVTQADDEPVSVGEETHHTRVKDYAMTFPHGGGGTWVNLTYAQGIGLIRQRHHSAGISGPGTYAEGTKTDMLVYARVGSRVYGQPLPF